MLAGYFSGRTSENAGYAKSNFRECPKGEVRRMLIPRTTVNKGKEKDRSVDAPVLLSIIRLLWELARTTRG
jgi:hypothetical protein